MENIHSDVRFKVAKDTKAQLCNSRGKKARNDLSY